MGLIGLPKNTMTRACLGKQIAIFDLPKKLSRLCACGHDGKKTRFVFLFLQGGGGGGGDSGGNSGGDSGVPVRGSSSRNDSRENWRQDETTSRLQ